MGGEREQVVQDKPGKRTPTEIQSQRGAQKIRIHESGGQVHFHDDKGNLKVAIATAKYWSKWEEIREGKLSLWTFQDPQNKSELKIQRPSPDADITIAITAMADFPTFAALDTFAAGR